MTFDLIQEAKKIISIPSISSDGNRELVDYLTPFCQRLGFHITYQSPGEGRGDFEVNLIAHTVPQHSPDLCPQGLALVTHLDTVPGGNPSLWTETENNPFNATLKGEKIYGLGSADTKLDFLCKLKALENIGLKNLKTPIALIGTYGEERSLAGARLLHETGLIHPKWALVSEPSELKPVIAHKGILYLEALHRSPTNAASSKKLTQIFTGKAAHGSMPHLGINAIQKAVGWLTQEQKKNPSLVLHSIRGGTVHNVVPASCEINYTYEEGVTSCARIDFLKNFFEALSVSEKYLGSHHNENFNPPHTTANVGVIRTEGNTVRMEFDFRLIPETDGNELFTIFKTLETHAPETEINVIRSNAPMATSEDSSIMTFVKKSLKEIGLPVTPLYKSGNTEGAIFNMMGAESIIIGPGKSMGNIHEPNEYNEIPQLEKAIAFYTSILKNFC